MSKTCILLTCEYPYITGEPFLENEMQYLSAAFDQIYLFPINASTKHIPTRNVPENVKVFPLGCILSKMRYPVYIMNGLFCSEKDLAITDKNPKKALLSAYERGRSNFVYHKILETIQANHLNVSDVVIYSYWFTDQAITAWRLKKHLTAQGHTVKAVCRAHGYDLYWERNSAGYLPYQDVTLKNLDGVYPCSDNGVLYLTEKHPNYTNKLHLARLGTLEHGHRQDANSNTIVTCCSLYKIKRISMFAKAFQLLCEHRQDCHWVCIGDGEELSWLAEFINANHLEENVTLLGRLPNEKVIEYYKTHDIKYFSNISMFEGVPVCIMEALSFGIPVIATNAGGTGELVSNENGVLLDVDVNHKQLANILDEAFSINNETYALKRMAARKTWEEKSSAEKNYTAWCRLLLE